LKDDEPVYIYTIEVLIDKNMEFKHKYTKLINYEIVEPSVSAYNSPLLLVPKKSLPSSDKKKVAISN